MRTFVKSAVFFAVCLSLTHAHANTSWDTYVKKCADAALNNMYNTFDNPQALEYIRQTQADIFGAFTGFDPASVKGTDLKLLELSRAYRTIGIEQLDVQGKTQAAMKFAYLLRYKIQSTDGRVAELLYADDVYALESELNYNCHFTKQFNTEKVHVAEKVR